MERYITEIGTQTDTMRTETEEQNRNIADGTLAASFDPTQTNVLPKPKSPVPTLDFTPLKNALTKLRESARAYAATIGAPGTADYTLPPERLQALDTLLIGTERAMLRSEGLPRRPWYRHQIYAPGFYTGYGVKTLPGVREAIEQRDWKEAGTEITLVADTLAQLAAQIDRAANTAKQSNR